MNMKITKKHIILGTSLSCVALLFSVLGFTGILKQASNNKDYSSWMKKLDDSTSLREINMPGSHDTMALYSIADLAGQCQSLSLEDQLNLGVRFLDIRLQLTSKNTLKVVHGIVDERATFDDVTSVVEHFLSDNPSEMIIMSVKKEAESSKFASMSFDDAVKSYLSKDTYLKDNSLPIIVSIADPVSSSSPTKSCFLS